MGREFCCRGAPAGPGVAPGELGNRADFSAVLEVALPVRKTITLLGMSI